MSVADAQASIHSAEFTEWMAYDRIAPIGVERIELAIAQFAAMFFNANKSQDAELKKPIDFMPYADKPMTAQSTDDMKRILTGED